MVVCHPGALSGGCPPCPPRLGGCASLGWAASTATGLRPAAQHPALRILTPSSARCFCRRAHAAQGAGRQVAQHAPPGARPEDALHPAPRLAVGWVALPAVFPSFGPPGRRAPYPLTLHFCSLKGGWDGAGPVPIRVANAPTAKSTASCMPHMLPWCPFPPAGSHNAKAVANTLRLYLSFEWMFKVGASIAAPPAGLNCCDGAPGLLPVAAALQAFATPCAKHLAASS